MGQLKGTELEKPVYCKEEITIDRGEFVHFRCEREKGHEGSCECRGFSVRREEVFRLQWKKPDPKTAEF